MNTKFYIRVLLLGLIISLAAVSCNKNSDELLSNKEFFFINQENIVITNLIEGEGYGVPSICCPTFSFDASSNQLSYIAMSYPSLYLNELKFLHGIHLKMIDGIGLTGDSEASVLENFIELPINRLGYSINTLSGDGSISLILDNEIHHKLKVREAYIDTVTRYESYISKDDDLSDTVKVEIITIRKITNYGKLNKSNIEVL